MGDPLPPSGPAGPSRGLRPPPGTLLSASVASARRLPSPTLSFPLGAVPAPTPGVVVSCPARHLGSVRGAARSPGGGRISVSLSLRDLGPGSSSLWASVAPLRKEPSAQRGLGEMVHGAMDRRMGLCPLTWRVSGASKGLAAKWLMCVVRGASFISTSSLSSGLSSSATGPPAALQTRSLTLTCSLCPTAPVSWLRARGCRPPVATRVPHSPRPSSTAAMISYKACRVSSRPDEGLRRPPRDLAAQEGPLLSGSSSLKHSALWFFLLVFVFVLIFLFPWTSLVILPVSTVPPPNSLEYPLPSVCQPLGTSSPCLIASLRSEQLEGRVWALHVF